MLSDWRPESHSSLTEGKTGARIGRSRAKDDHPAPGRRQAAGLLPSRRGKRSKRKSHEGLVEDRKIRLSWLFYFSAEGRDKIPPRRGEGRWV